MDTNDLRTYRILEEIDKSPPPSQRELAQKLGISLGLVNAFIKRLARKGYFKITTIPKNRVKYILTPIGVAEKARLTYDFIHYSFRYYRDTRRRLRGLFSEMGLRLEKRVVFYGVSELTEIAYVTLQETDLELVAVVDEMQAQKKFFKYVVISLKELSAIEFDVVLLTRVDPSHGNRIPKIFNDLPVNKLVKIL